MQNHEQLGHGSSHNKMRRSRGNRTSQSTSCLLSMRPRPFKSFKRMTTHDGTLPPKSILKKNGSSRFLSEASRQASFSKKVSFSDSMNNRWNSNGSKVNLKASIVEINAALSPQLPYDQAPTKAKGNSTWGTSTTASTSASKSKSAIMGPIKTTLNVSLDVLKEEMKKFSPPPKPSRRTSREAHGLPIRPKRNPSNDGSNPFKASLDNFHSALVLEARGARSNESDSTLEWPTTTTSAPVLPRRRTSLEKEPKDDASQSPMKPERRTSLQIPEDSPILEDLDHSILDDCPVAQSA